MTAEILCVGTELLLGNILNTDAKYLSGRLADLGVSVYFQTVVGDNEARLKAAFLAALSRSDIVITTGGLGPTNDDITKETISETLGLALIEDTAVRKRIDSYFIRMGREIAEINYKQALVPKGARILNNEFGTAPAILIEKDNKAVFLLPGPMTELKPLFEKYVASYIEEKSNCVIYSETLKVTELGESPTAQRIKDILEESTNPTVSPYAKFGETHLRITARADNVTAAKKMISPVKSEIINRLGEYYVFTDNIEESLEEKLVKILKEKNLTISVAESCTGGILAGKIVNVKGASDVFKYGFVTYSDEAKINVLGVDIETLNKFGAVSAECAEEMAKGAAKVSGADISLSVTGYASEIPDTPEMSGTVFIGCYYKDVTEVFRFRFGRDRNGIRNQAAIRALDIGRRRLLNLKDILKPLN